MGVNMGCVPGSYFGCCNLLTRAFQGRVATFIEEYCVILKKLLQT
jgi:hypothetical protein